MDPPLAVRPISAALLRLKLDVVLPELYPVKQPAAAVVVVVVVIIVKKYHKINSRETTITVGI